MIPDNSYDGQLFSKSIRLLTDLAQELVAFFTESFMKAIESLVELFLMFIKAVWEAKPEDMRNFFVKLFDTMLSVILEFAKGLLGILFKGPFKGMWDVICGAVQLLQKASEALLCDPWIPVGLSVTCPFNDDRCKIDVKLGLTKFGETIIPEQAPLGPASNWKPSYPTVLGGLESITRLTGPDPNNPHYVRDSYGTPYIVTRGEWMPTNGSWVDYNSWLYNYAWNDVGDDTVTTSAGTTSAYDIAWAPVLNPTWPTLYPERSDNLHN